MRRRAIVLGLCASSFVCATGGADPGADYSDDTSYGALVVLRSFTNVSREDLHKTAQTANSKIVKGVPVKHGTFPWMVAIGIGSGSTFSESCGGALISERVVLTAGHCDIECKDTVVAGRVDLRSKTGDEALVETIERGPFDPKTFTGDYAVIVLDRPLHYQTIEPEQASDVFYSKSGNPMTIAGWGRESYNGPASDKLLRADIHTKDLIACRSQYEFAGKNLYDQMYCGTSDKGDACSGDSGGPAIRSYPHNRYTVIGVVSWGKDCGQKAYPGVYTEVGSAVINLIDKYRNLTKVVPN